MVERRRSSSAYRRAQLAARAREGALSATTARAVSQALRAYADDLAKILSSFPAGELSASLTTKRITLLNKTALRLERRITRAIASHRNISFNTVQKIWRKAGLEAAEAGGVARGLLGAVRRPPITLLGAFESVGGAHWKTLIKGYTQAGALEVNQLVSRALLEGVTPEILARRLRPYVQGAQPLIKAFGGLGFDPRRLVDPTLRGAARRMNYNARRISISEIHNARAEAEVQHFIADPLVGSVFWRLAPDRGPTARPDQCDILASENLYDLGPGVFPVDAVPLTPHPFDRCERVPKVRPVSQAGRPKRIGLQRRGIEHKFKNMSKASADRIRLETNKLLQLTDQRNVDVRSLLPPIKTGVSSGIAPSITTDLAPALTGTKAKNVLNKTFKGFKATPAEFVALKEYQGAAYLGMNIMHRRFSGSAVRIAKAGILTEFFAAKIAKWSKQLDALLRRAPVLQQRITVYRAVEVPGSLFHIGGITPLGTPLLTQAAKAEARKKMFTLPGSVMTDQGFLSTTTSRAQAVNWGNTSKGGILFEIDIPVGTRVAWPNSIAPGEQVNYIVKDELLLPRGTKIKINSVELIGNEFVVKGEVLP